MSEGVTYSWDLYKSTFNKIVEKMKNKRKKVYILFTKAGGVLTENYRKGLK